VVVREEILQVNLEHKVTVCLVIHDEQHALALVLCRHPVRRR
jgi:ABC-type nitrate/sulfonate/bicarbonate transport system ATPase subunit